jgi:signal transduction histidine kinase
MLKRLPVFGQTTLLAIGFAIVLLVSITEFYISDRFNDATASVSHTIEVQKKISNLLLTIRRSESAQRGFILTDRPIYLQDYQDSVADIRPNFDELRMLVSDSARQEANLDEAEPLLQSKLNELGETIQLATGGQRDKASDIVKAGAGQRRMESLRGIFERMLAVEANLLDERSHDANRLQLTLLVLGLLALGLLMTIGALSVFLFRRTLMQRERARAALEEGYANLEGIVDERTSDMREANDEMQRFAYIVSHDLRSPLVNIMGFTAELEALRDDAFQKIAALQVQANSPPSDADEQIAKDFDEAIGFIKTSIGKMDRLIHAILRISREGRRELNAELVDMDTLLGTISDSLAHQAEERDATVEVAKLPPVMSDKLALEQIFSNLIDNALKYLRKGEPGRIEVRSRQTNTHVIFEVQDNGRGIAPEDYQRVFDLFRRAGVQDRPGEGIGLAHVRALVRRLGGTMSLSSEIGKGSVFSVTLPRRWTSEKERNAA